MKPGAGRRTTRPHAAQPAPRLLARPAALSTTPPRMPAIRSPPIPPGGGGAGAKLRL